MRKQRNDAVRRSASPAGVGATTWICLGLVAATVAVYAPLRGHEFVRWDDPLYVYANPHVTAGLTWEGVRWAFTTGHAGNWHPLTWLSHMLDVRLFGMDAGAHHLVNLALHVASTLLLFDVLRRMTHAPGRSAFVAALFAVHPLHVESVAWASERKDVLSTLFFMLTLRAYVAYVAVPTTRRYAIVIVCFAAGLMSKPMLVTLPFVLLLLDWWPLSRTSTAPSLWPLVREKLPLFALAAASCVVTFLVQRSGAAVIGVETFPVGERVANALTSYVAYVGKTLWPAGLAALYPVSRTVPAWQPTLAALILTGVSVVAVREARRRPYVIVGWLWFLGTLVPVIGLVQVGRQSMADRYTYVPIIGLFVVVAWGVADLVERWPQRRVALSAAAVVTVVACMAVARSQVAYWHDGVALWEHTLACTENNELAHNNLGALLIDAGRLDEAVVHFEAALRVSPDFVEAHNNLGHALRRQGRVDEAVVQLREALRLRPDTPEVHDNLGLALAQQGKADESALHFEEALRLAPDYADAHYNLGVAMRDRGRFDAAVREFEAVLRIDPAHQDARNELASLAARGVRPGGDGR